MNSRARELIDTLHLQPHPEGGYFREVYRSSQTLDHPITGARRNAVTSIYFLLAAGQQSAWHRVTSDEVWHLYEGGPLELLLADPQLSSIECIALTHVSATAGPTHTVPAGWWQAARPLGEFALVGCTVAPGFDFADFSFLRDQRELCEALRAVRPELLSLL